MSDFAKNQLLKFGWSEGKGLGKDENGITRPIKVTLKSGVEGLGYKETFDTWWEKQYNSAIQSIQVKSSQDGVTLSTVESDFSKMKENKSKTHSLYADLQKISILHNGCLTQDNSTTTSEEKVETAQASVRPPCTLNAKLERIALQDQSLKSAMSSSSYNSLFKHSSLPYPSTHRSVFSRLSLPRYSVSVPHRHTSETKPEYAMLNKVNQTPEKEEEEDEYETNNNIMYTLRTITTASKSSSRKFRKKLNNLMHQLNSCSIKETESKSDLVTDQFLRNVRGNRKKCLKAKGKLECAQLIKEKDLQSMKEDTDKQARKQSEKEYGPVIQLKVDDDTPSSKEENYKPPHEPLVRGSTCVITLTKFGASRHGDTDMVSTKNIKNSLYFHKSKKRRKNKHKHNQRSKIEDVIKNLVNKRDIDAVAKALTEINLTEDVSATKRELQILQSGKKKPTQTHITPV